MGYHENLQKLKQTFKESLSKDLKKTFLLLKEKISNSNNKQDDLFLIEQRFQSLTQKKLKGIISTERISLVENQVRDELLTFINCLTYKDFEEVNTSLSLFSSKQLKKLFSKLDRVDCDRKTVSQKFWVRFRQKKANACHHYFLPAQKEQHPHSVVERWVYELLGEGKEIRFEEKNNSQNILINPFPQSINLQESKFEVKKYFNKKFGFHLNKLEELFGQKQYLTQYDYIVKVFHITTNEEEWNNYIKDLINWWISNFCQTQNKQNPTFLFFYIVYLEEEEDNLMDKLKLLFKKKTQFSKVITEELSFFEKIYPQNCTILPKLTPVTLKEFEDWVFEKITNNDFESKKVVSSILNDLDEKLKKRFKSEKGFAMSFIESKITQLIKSKSQKTM